MSRDTAAVRARIDAPDADIEITQQFFSACEADEFSETLTREADWTQQVLKIFGRDALAPRLSAWYGDPGASYAYSGLRLEPKPWLPALREIRGRVEHATGCRFNSVLLNLYRDGRDGMGWHSDNERELGDTPTIASLSLGGERRFLLRHRSRRDLDPLELHPGHGSLILMAGTTQRYWKHSLPKTARPVPPRLNLTYRNIVEPA